MKLPRMFWAGLAAFCLVGAAGLTALAQPTHAHAATGGPITTRQLEATPAVPLVGFGGPSTSQFDYWCLNGSGHKACDFYPYGCSSDSSNGPKQVQLDGSPDDVYCKYLDWPGYTFRYSSKYLLLYNGSNGCLHIHKDINGDWMDVVTCNTTDKNQRWSFPMGYATNEIKSSGDDACVQLHMNVVTGTPDAYQMHTCNASQSLQDMKWYPPGT